MSDSKRSPSVREVVEAVAEQLQAGRAVGLATVVDVWSSAPLPVGTMMAVLDDGRGGAER